MSTAETIRVLKVLARAAKSYGNSTDFIRGITRGEADIITTFYYQKNPEAALRIFWARSVSGRALEKNT